MNQLLVKEMNQKFAEEIINWTYEPPYDFYNNELSEESLQELLNNEYRAVVDSENNLVGFYCVGNSAQVPMGRQFGAYSKQYPDIGLGMKPNLTGKGKGSQFFSFILDEIQKEHSLPIRLTVAKFNERAIRLYEKFGFTKEMEFESPSAVFITMMKNQ